MPLPEAEVSKDIRSLDTEPHTKDPEKNVEKKRTQKHERKTKEMSIVLKEADSMESRSISSSKLVLLDSLLN